MTKLKEGDKAPAFSLPDSNNKIRKLKDYLGKKVILYFYPKDNTPGCTKQACSFRDSIKEYEKIKTPVIGISSDSIESHKKFKKKHDLPFTILSDKDKEIMKMYDVIGAKSLWGRTFLGVKRTSFIINEKGIIEKVYENVKADKNALEILEYLKKS